MTHVLGVDAGNSKTIALVARTDGSIVGWGRGGCGDIHGAPTSAPALRAVESAVQSALAAAGIEPHLLAAGGFSMAGADWPEDFEFLRAEMGRRGWGKRVVVVNDAIGALRAGSPDGTGAVVVCGTAAATGARTADGRSWHSGFWPEFHGSHQLAYKTLRAVYRAALGIDPPTALTLRVLEFFGQPEVEDVLHLFSTREIEPPGPGTIEGLARALLDEAATGDPTARRIVRDHGSGLGEYVLAAARQVGIAGSPFTLVLAGGVLRHPSSLLADAIVQRVRSASPGVCPVRSRFEPVVGALFLALEAADVPVEEGLLGRLAPTLPPAALFET